ncbi:MAG: efflux RND transporter periplasmic adaptor subunit [Pseudomonadota bacterium]
MRQLFKMEHSNSFWLSLLGVLFASAVFATSSSKAEPSSKTVIDFTFKGVIEPFDRRIVSNRVTGVVATVHVNPGLPVEKGDILFTMDKKPFELAAAVAQAQRDEAEAQLARAEEIESRRVELHNRNAGTLASAQQAKFDAEIARAVLAQATAKLAQATLDLKNTDIRAETSGVIGSITAKAGQFVEAEANTELAEIVQVNPVRVRYQVPHEARQKAMAFSNAKSVQEMLGKVRFTVHEPDGAKHPHEGRADFESTVIDPETGTLTTWGHVANPNRTLVPGLKVDVVSRIVSERNAETQQQTDTNIVASPSPSKGGATHD